MILDEEAAGRVSASQSAEAKPSLDETSTENDLKSQGVLKTGNYTGFLDIEGASTSVHHNYFSKNKRIPSLRFIHEDLSHSLQVEALRETGITNQTFNEAVQPQKEETPEIQSKGTQEHPNTPKQDNFFREAEQNKDKELNQTIDNSMSQFIPQQTTSPSPKRKKLKPLRSDAPSNPGTQKPIQEASGSIREASPPNQLKSRDIEPEDNPLLVEPKRRKKKS